jgi:hypothetical protein
LCSTSTNLKRKSPGGDEDDSPENPDTPSDDELSQEADINIMQPEDLEPHQDPAQDQPTTERINIPRPRPKQPRQQTNKRKALNEELEVEVLSAIKACTAAVGQKEVIKPSDPYELYALSLVPDFKRLSGQNFAILKARVASLMVELEYGETSSGSSNVPQPSFPARTSYFDSGLCTPAFNLSRAAPQWLPEGSAWGYGAGSLIPQALPRQADSSLQYMGPPSLLPNPVQRTSTVTHESFSSLLSNISLPSDIDNTN